MTYSLSTLRNSKSSTEKLLKAINDQKNKFQADERYWKLTVDKAGNGFAIIRFLAEPPCDGENGVPVSAPLWKHFFKGPTGQIYAENCLTTLGLPDPVTEYNKKLWDTGIKTNRDIASEQKRNLSYVSNIRVVNDTAKPENNGKVFLFSYGQTIYDMIQERLPELKKEGVFYPPEFQFFNPFDMDKGANFNLAARVGTNKRRTYDKSSFSAPSPIAKTDAEIERIWNQAYSLKDVTDPRHFKTYEQLKARLDVVLNKNGSANDVPLPSAEESIAAEVEDAVIMDTDILPEDLEKFARLADG